jgi:hypothetical protein
MYVETDSGKNWQPGMYKTFQPHQLRFMSHLRERAIMRLRDSNAGRLGEVHDRAGDRWRPAVLTSAPPGGPAVLTGAAVRRVAVLSGAAVLLGRQASGGLPC